MKSDEDDLEAQINATIGVDSDQVMGVHRVGANVGDDLEAQINAAIGVDSDQVMGVHRVGANVGSEVEVSAALHRDPILGVAMAPLTNVSDVLVVAGDAMSQGPSIEAVAPVAQCACCC